jgi:hypothetical protein
MLDRLMIRTLAFIVAVSLVSSIPVLADETQSENLSIDAAMDVTGEDSALEEIPAGDIMTGEDSALEEIPAGDIMTGEDSVLEEIPAGDIITGESAAEAETAAEDVREEDREEQAVYDMSQISEELTGAYWYYFIETGTLYEFRCNNETDYNCYMFTPETSGTYRMDLTRTSGKVFGTVYTSKDGVSLNKIDNWTDYYDENGYHITISMQANLKYVFRIFPGTDRVDKGKFRINKTTKEVKSAKATLKSGRHLTVGSPQDGAWHVIGKRNVWKFKPERLLDLYTVDIKFTDGSSLKWSYSDNGAYVGSTYFMMRVTQDIDNWAVGEDAYCDLWFCDAVGDMRVKIPYLLFKDVQDPSNPYYKAIYWAASNGITKGYSDNTFGINKTCTRGEAVMFLWRLMGKPEPKAQAKSPFSDVSKTHAFYKAILWASQKGITKGFGDGTFGINKKCTRGQIMMFIWRAKGMPAPKTVTKSPFKDVAKTHVFYKAILWGSQKGVTKGFNDGTFGVNKDCTRGQIVTFLYRIK